ncbi:hypothetical protein ACIQTT_07240 [Microbacterium sp. NPDC090225]|uniref:hypothetical protein n=1 Tax=Microbacterium sp. NPDC090225 TaxID=3364207 RepID=UPI003801C1EE
MLIAGLLVSTAGLALFLASLIRVVRANPGRRVPYWREAEITPKWAIAMRAGAAGLLVLGVGLASTAADVAWPWGALPLLLVWVALTIAVIATHNARIRR